MRYLKRVLLFTLAILGVLTRLLCAVVQGAIPIYCSYVTDNQIEQLFAGMQMAIQAEDYATAAHLMSLSYRQSHVPNDLRHWPDSMHFRLEPHYFFRDNRRASQGLSTSM
jgi:hypothetical protein